MPHKIIKPEKRQCLKCNQQFIATNFFKTYCSTKCVNATAEAKRRLVHGIRKIHPNNCLHCGKGFLGREKHTIFCSASCARKNAWATGVLNKSYFRRGSAHAQWKGGYTDARMRRLYNITLADYNLILSSQNGGCAICNKKEKNRYLSIDHDHSTGKVRGLLCGDCNLALGLMRDNPEFLSRAISYLDYELKFEQGECVVPIGRTL